MTPTYRPFSLEWWYHFTCWFFRTSGIFTKQPRCTLWPYVTITFFFRTLVSQMSYVSLPTSCIVEMKNQNIVLFENCVRTENSQKLCKVDAESCVMRTCGRFNWTDARIFHKSRPDCDRTLECSSKDIHIYRYMYAGLCTVKATPVTTFASASKLVFAHSVWWDLAPAETLMTTTTTTTPTTPTTTTTRTTRNANARMHHPCLHVYAFVCLLTTRRLLAVCALAVALALTCKIAQHVSNSN